MSLTAGSRIGPYEVVSALGAGGMGEVYRARDTRLNRDVALKILPEIFAADPERLARFEREAHVLASLNHPNIAQIYGLEEGREGGPYESGVQAGYQTGVGAAFRRPVRALVMELVEGETLADRVARGSIPIDDALPIARQIAEALEAAHEQGIIHRDLKPANIKVRGDGTVKVLDFGLAKALEPVSTISVDATVSPTITSPATMTGIGVLLGTAAYMSPEQARGRIVDKRTDIWAFGCVLFEMLTGTSAFAGDDVAETIGAVIHRQPAWERLPAALPPRVRLVIERCLEKDPKRRIRDIGDVQLALTGAFEPEAPVAEKSARGRRRSSVVIAALGGAAATALIAGAIWWFAKPAPAAVRPVRFTITPPASRPLNLQGFFRQIAVSPDGSTVAYIAGGDFQLMLRRLDQLEPTPVRGVTTAGFPFFSPDGRWIGFFVGGNGELRKVPVSGGPAVSIGRYKGTPRGASWAPDDTIVFATNDPSTGLLSVSAEGGEPKVLTTPDQKRGEDHWMPSLSPDGDVVFFTVTNGNSADNAQIAALDLKSGRHTTLVRGGSDAVFVAPVSPQRQARGRNGFLVYGVAGALRAVQVDVTSLSVIGDSMPVLDQVAMMQTGATDFAVSRDGTLVYVPGAEGMGLSQSLVWVSREGHEEPLDLPPRPYTVARLSPDGTRIAVDIRAEENDVWIYDLIRRTMTRLTFDHGIDSNPIWSPDGRRIVFLSTRSGAQKLYWQSADGTGAVEQLTMRAAGAPASFSPDGRVLVFQDGTTETSADVALLRLSPEPHAEPLLTTPFLEGAADISPDGHWLAYHSNESGIDQVYVRPFPDVDSGRWQVSTAGGSRPAWSRNGKELFFLDPSTAMMAVPVQTKPTFSAGVPVKLFDGPWYAVQTARPYDVSSDGRRFLMIASAGAETRGRSATMTVVLNWGAELQQRVVAH